MTTAQISHHCPNDSGHDLSFIIEPTGQILPASPDGNEFSPGHVRDYLAGPPELLCRTQDGFFLFRNKEADAYGLPLNQLATAFCLELSSAEGSVVGRVFVAHPDHIAAYMKTK